MPGHPDLRRTCHRLRSLMYLCSRRTAGAEERHQKRSSRTASVSLRVPPEIPPRGRGPVLLSSPVAAAGAQGSVSHAQPAHGWLGFSGPCSCPHGCREEAWSPATHGRTLLHHWLPPCIAETLLIAHFLTLTTEISHCGLHRKGETLDVLIPGLRSICCASHSPTSCPQHNIKAQH